MKGRVHSIESMGLVDGPGVRCVVFLQGCPLRCLYCHNPDSQGAGGSQMEAAQLVKQLVRFRSYFEKSGGGVTCSGGEPLSQPEFLAEVLARVQHAGIHTCLDTSGVGLGDYDSILAHTDLVLFDVKHHSQEGYRQITGGEIHATDPFLEAVRRAHVPMWVRHVVVPGLTDQAEHLAALRAYVDTLPHVQRVELLPFHKLGAHKYQALGLADPLADTPPMDRETCNKLQQTCFAQDRNGGLQHDVE